MVMVLDSQIARAGGSRRHMASRRRRGRRWPWLVVVAAVVALGWFVWPGGGSEGDADGGRLADAGLNEPVGADGGVSSSAAADDPGDAAAAGRTAEQTTGGLGQGAGGRGAGSRGDDGPGQAAQASEPDDTPSLTLGDGVEEASGGEPELDPDDLSFGPGREADEGGASGSEDSPADASQAHEPMDRRAGDAQGQAQAQAQGAIEAETPDDPAAHAQSVAQGGSGEFQAGMDLIAEGDFVEGRAVLSRLLFSGQLGPSDAQTVRDTLTSVNRELVFSDEVAPNDPIAERYTVQPGDFLVSIARQYKVPDTFIGQINGISDPRHLQAGQNIKLIKGPFDARIEKGAYRMDVTVDGPDGEPIYIRSFPVGLGENDSTPPGEWVVAPGRKVVNPSWRNPRTGEFFSADDPENPIGDYWIALEGIDEDTRDLTGYGIHGTIEPHTIGTQASMGCVRLLDDDIEQLYYMLAEGESRVSVMP